MDDWIHLDTEKNPVGGSNIKVFDKIAAALTKKAAQTARSNLGR